MKNHCFNVKVAEKVGLEEAILLNNIAFWCKKNEENKKNFKSGFYWTYNSIKAYQEMFPYMKEYKIRTSLNNLVTAGLIITGNFNHNRFDRTKWYTVTPDGWQYFVKETDKISGKEELQ